MSDTDYNRLNAQRAASLLPLAGKRVLIVGCNTGRDCRHFVEFGAAEVHGLDVVRNTGADYTHPRVHYHVMSAEEMALPDNSFDLVYCFATMEHVRRIELAFREIVRVTAPGGYVYSIASPLWNSSYGHHKRNLFLGFPWIHLRMEIDEILAWCQRTGATDPAGLAIRVHVEYMLNPAYFNRTPSSRYIEVCRELPRMIPVQNRLDFDKESPLTEAIYAELAPKGYAREELLAKTHTYVARKSDEELMTAGGVAWLRRAWSQVRGMVGLSNSGN